MSRIYQRPLEWLVDENGCWNVMSHKSRIDGYHKVERKRKPHLAHRLMWERVYGPIPKGICVLHRCDNPSCVNLDHLFLGTQAENIIDMCKKKRNRNIPMHAEKHPMSKLTWKDVEKIRNLKGKIPQNKIAEMFGVGAMTISRVINNKLWKVKNEKE